MPQDGYYLTQEDVEALRDLLEQSDKTVHSLTPRGRPRTDINDQEVTPQSYVVLTPIGGIPALSEGPDAGTALGTGDIPGAADCKIYRLLTVSGTLQLEPTAFTRKVYNLGTTAIAGTNWALVTRDGFGAWYATAITVSSGGTTSGIEIKENVGTADFTPTTVLVVNQTDGYQILQTTGSTVQLNYLAASTTQKGAVTTGTQTFAGNKTFTGVVEVGSLLVDNSLVVTAGGSILGGTDLRLLFSTITGITAGGMHCYFRSGSFSSKYYRFAYHNATSASIDGDGFLEFQRAGATGQLVLDLSDGQSGTTTPAYSCQANLGLTTTVNYMSSDGVTTGTLTFTGGILTGSSGGYMAAMMAPQERVGPHGPVAAWGEGPPQSITVPLPPSLDLHPRSKRALVTVGARHTGRDLLAITGPYMAAYAERLGVDFVVLDWEGLPYWPMSSKYAIGRTLDHYYRIAYVDADVLLRPSCVDLFDGCPHGYFGACDELPFHKDQPQYGTLKQYLNLRRFIGAPERDITWQFNAGVYVAERRHQRYLLPPPYPIPPDYYLAEQLNLNSRILDDDIPYHDMSRVCNWQWWTDHEFAQAPPEAILHFSGMPHQQRLIEMRRWAERYPLE